MKSLLKLFSEHPGYTKWGNTRIAELTGLKEKTISSFKRTAEFRDLKKTYISKLNGKTRISK